MSDAPSTIPWESWTAAAFGRAAAERKPVLLSLTASWCHGCEVMDATTYADPRIIAEVTSGFVPVRVDTDRRPDVNGRYNLDGWPTTALLTPSGEVLTGSTYLPPEAMLAMLVEGRTAMERGYDALMGRAERAAHERRRVPPPPRYEPDGEAPRWVLSRMFEEEDREHGGFGAGGKFLPAAPLALALACQQVQPDDRLLALIVRTLDAVCWGALFDEVDGGFFRYAANRDFSRPHTEKLLEDQLAFIPVLLDAGRITGRTVYTARALEIVRYVQRTLMDADAFLASQAPDQEYYALSGSIRASMDAPRVDRTIFADRNAQGIVAWLRTARASGQNELATAAERTAREVLIPAFDAERGIAHWPGSERGAALLTDQVHGAVALLQLAAATGRDEYLRLGRDVMEVAIRRLWDARDGGFLDRAGENDDVGLLRDPRKPLVLNSLAACALARLGRLTGADHWRVRARETLGAVTSAYKAEGLGAAPYALAVVEVLGDG